MIFPSINDVMTDNRFQILEDMLLADRSVRRFDESHGIEKSTVERIVGLDSALQMLQREMEGFSHGEY